jgi:methionyl-tRNA formyltransferase
MTIRDARIAVAGNKYTTLELMQFLIDTGWAIDLLIHLDADTARKADVAGYTSLDGFARSHGIQVYNPRKYSLSDRADLEAVKSLAPDIILVAGWQRLIPGTILDGLRFGAFGMHGSPEPLPRGRGRSPLNWSILNGKTSFVTNLFRYKPGVDDGDIVGSQKFAILPFDDCHTLHLKNIMSMERLLQAHLSEIVSGQARYRKQSDLIEPTYFPKRTAEDGRIQWLDHDMESLHRHVRCQTHPFPGAFSHLDGVDERTYFWEVQPFDQFLDFPGSLPGEVVRVFEDGTFLVSVWDGSLLAKKVTVDRQGKVAATVRRGQRFYSMPDSIEESRPT